MNWSKRRERFRTFLAEGRCVYPASVFDPISAHIAEDLGFEVGIFAGSVCSYTVLGVPDLVLLTLTELASQANRICRAGDLPIMVDAGHGYGNALNVKRTVEEMETAGVCALFIEDTVMPAPFGATKSRNLISVEEGVGKMRAALAGREDPKLVVVGRTKLLSITDDAIIDDAIIDDVIARAKAYVAAGVDAMFFAGVRTRAQLDAIFSVVKVPIMLGTSGAELYDCDYLTSRGVRVCLQGHQPFLAAVKATYETLKALRDGTPQAEIKNVVSTDLLRRITRASEYDRMSKDFLSLT
jgi:carboxyvinyl-carboxyphosphonate phosphorylmutase